MYKYVYHRCGPNKIIGKRFGKWIEADIVIIMMIEYLLAIFPGQAIRKMMKVIFLLAILIFLSSCSKKKNSDELDVGENQRKAASLFQERCKVAGVKIYRTATDVEGIYIIKIRKEQDFENQFGMDDPYGRDFTGDAYVGSFLRGHYQADGIIEGASKLEEPRHLGFLYVDAVDHSDNKRYRYTGSVREHESVAGQISGPKRKILTTGYVVDRVLAHAPIPRYGVTFSDISTPLERKYWIAGSSLQVIDLLNNEIMAERIGYMFDTEQGSKAGMRSPWLLAAKNACPRFRHDSTYGQIWQTLEFVEKVLQPKK